MVEPAGRVPVVAVQHLPPPVELGGRALLLGPGGDVGLVEAPTVSAVGSQVAAVAGTDGVRPVGVIVADPAAVSPAVAAGASLVIVEAPLAVAPEVIAAATAGVVIIVGGAHGDARRAVRSLVGRGAAARRVMVEVTVRAGDPVDLGALSGPDGLGVAAVLGRAAIPGPAPVLGSAEGSGDAGWEIGVLTRLLTAGVVAIRGVDSVRFRRVRSVVEAIDEATNGAATNDGATEDGATNGATTNGGATEDGAAKDGAAKAVTPGGAGRAVDPSTAAQGLAPAEGSGGRHPR